jgi:hypothetical protein
MMKKNLQFSFVVLLMCIFIMAPLAFGQQEQDKGRFNLFNAVYHSALLQKSAATTIVEKKLVRIDSVTGETWMLLDVLQQGKVIKYWEKIDEGPENGKKD